MKPACVDREKLRDALRQMRRGYLLKVAERAIDLVSSETLEALVGDFMQVPRLAEGQPGEASLPDEVNEFSEESLRGDYFDSFDVNSKNCMDLSQGTDAFIAEFDRLIRRCLGTAAGGSFTTAREAFERLFALLRRIDEDPDSIVFFADEAGSWQIPVDWRAVLPVYFRCLAEGTSGAAFARAVDGVVTDFCHYQRPHQLAAAESVANAEQMAALQRLPIRNGRR
jgi:hypothetical protein